MSNTVKTNTPTHKNPLETLPESGYTPLPQNEVQHAPEQHHEAPKPEKKGPINSEFTQVFDFHSHEDPLKIQSLEQELRGLTEQIKMEIKDIKNHSAGVQTEVADIEKAMLQMQGVEKPGAYHIQYLEMVLQFLRNIRTKVGEARTWLTAFQSKKAKRGSAFAMNVKKKGNDYLLSQEHQASRSVQ